MQRVETPLYDAAQIRQGETQLFAHHDSFAIMQRAAEALLTVINECFPLAKHLTDNVDENAAENITENRAENRGTYRVVLGCGNNAGDGLVLAARLKQQGQAVICYTVFDQPRSQSLPPFTGDAAQAYQMAQDSGVPIVPVAKWQSQPTDVIIDAIFGIGLDRPPTGDAQWAIRAINQANAAAVVAVDVPSGLRCDTGQAYTDVADEAGDIDSIDSIEGADLNAVQADMTVTFIGDKIGLHTADGKGLSGQVVVATLGAVLPANLAEATVVRYHCVYHRVYHCGADERRRQQQLNQSGQSRQSGQSGQSRRFSSGNQHKGDFGHVLTIGGGQGMFGGAALAAVSALKVGAGKSSLYAHPDYQSQFHLDGTPLYEVMRCHDLHAIDASICFNAICLGPGLGRDDWGWAQFKTVTERLTTNQRLLIDADGLYHLANSDNHSANRLENAIAVITPHEGEAARLLQITVAAVRQDKPAIVKQLAQTYRCIAVLKGAGTLISDGNSVWINESGNVNLATAGTGDVLAGVISGLLAQGYTPLDAALQGVYRHGLAADDYCAEKKRHSVNKAGGKTLRASDLWSYF
ncbi:NAD(P)H-hydrate dehydratase [Ostreibacterium oceani]|uniref:Bifunctional NAD(P)H-hydrate repair enzyme n=1 Tax=Ostreibacterium oceani TaxID=2654998 RepID=A0A6N7EVN5_9GAMM|nr:NAD(P)H-hydrate dehydratase [Ostreibacterium oceani]MPV85655.1 NAD(P)H-hydrate dehydratase [Ostreibacterium oceani]